MKNGILKVRLRLVVAFLIVIFVPIILISLGSIIYTKYQLKVIEDYYNITGEGINTFSNNTKLLDGLTKKEYEEMSELAEYSPESFEDEEFLNAINARLNDKESFLLVIRDKNIIYNGSKGTESLERFYRILNGFMGADINIKEDEFNNEGYYITGKYLIKMGDFEFPDLSRGMFFILTSTEKMVPEVRNMLSGIVFLIIIVMIVTAIVMTTWIYKSIFAPLKQLQKATHEIKEGNLEYSINEIRNDEIGDLCRDFEDMRIHLKETAEESMQYERDNKELISNISHDLKTPITAIKGYIEGIMDGVADTPEKMERYIKTIYNKTIEMNRLIEELTFYSKIDTNRIPYTFDKVNVDRYFSDCSEELALDLAEKNIDVIYRNDVDKSTVIIADVEQFKKVINNIVGNSVKYIGKDNGLIKIHITDAGDFVQIEISDNGIGIEQKDLPYIFDRFYRSDTSRNSMQGGSGIGLSIVKKIVEDHGGKIWALSQKGEGTTMCMVFRKYEEVNYEQNTDSGR